MATRHTSEKAAKLQAQLAALARAVIKWDKEWHGMMWDGAATWPEEEKAWEKIMKKARRGLGSCHS